jgi:inner membrane protein
MDPLTHTATGLFLSRSGLKRLTPLATPILLIAANAPDIDIVSAAGGPLSYLHYHRYLTHALVAAPVMALLSVAVVRAAARKPIRWLGAWIAATIGVLSHLALDSTNIYGIRLLLPFSGRWQGLQTTTVIDLWIWAVCLLAITGPFVGRLVGSEISSGAVRIRHHGRGFAILALVFLALYTGGRAILHHRAEAVLDSRIYEEEPPLRVAAFPDVVNPWRWRGLVETHGILGLKDVDLAGGFDPSRALILHKPEPDPAIEAARRTPVFQEFLRFNQYPYWRVSPAQDVDGGKLVQVFDLRFGTPMVPGLMASAVLDARLRVLKTEVQLGAIRPK